MFWKEIFEFNRYELQIIVNCESIKCILLLDCRRPLDQRVVRRNHREGEAGERGGPGGPPPARRPGARVERGESPGAEPWRRQRHHRRLAAGAQHRAPRVQTG